MYRIKIFLSCIARTSTLVRIEYTAIIYSQFVLFVQYKAMDSFAEAFPDAEVDGAPPVVQQTQVENAAPPPVELLAPVAAPLVSTRGELNNGGRGGAFNVGVLVPGGGGRGRGRGRGRASGRRAPARGLGLGRRRLTATGEYVAVGPLVRGITVDGTPGWVAPLPDGHIPAPLVQGLSQMGIRHSNVASGDGSSSRSPPPLLVRGSTAPASTSPPPASRRDRPPATSTASSSTNPPPAARRRRPPPARAPRAPRAATAVAPAAPVAAIAPAAPAASSPPPARRRPRAGTTRAPCAPRAKSAAAPRRSRTVGPAPDSNLPSQAVIGRLPASVVAAVWPERADAAPTDPGHVDAFPTDAAPVDTAPADAAPAHGCWNCSGGSCSSRSHGCWG